MEFQGDELTMKKGTIRKIYDYYFPREEYHTEIEQAMREFYDRPNLSRWSHRATEPGEEARFMEWFLYDYKLQNGQSLLESFIATNPLKLSKSEEAIYSGLLLTNEYGWYEIMAIVPEKSMTLRNVQTNKRLVVQEKMGTYQASVGALITGRVAKIEDHFELVGSDPVYFPVQISPRARKQLLQGKDRLDPKIVNDLLKRKRR